ncbi:Tex family protein [Ferrimonas balearica]|uniref:Tex family protein n=1 Tax=Ferrimonas balearica TaxID=44012 RepID=UPI001C963987|nr:Tex family protein [Ferrimonas balearica]MBY5982060.1 RNA-binding transcriptional accessory protein [Ferrimonas balearica]
MEPISHLIAQELGVRPQQVQAAITLLDDGATVPFIARYRKEVTGTLDDTQLRTLETRLGYLRELSDRRQSILKSIDEQGKLSDSLRAAIEAADTKTALEDLYLPYKPKRRTKGQIAIEAGLLPLADSLFDNPNQDPEQSASAYLNAEAGFDTTKAVLDGARAILMERFAEDATLLAKIRQHLQQNAHLKSQVISGQESNGAKFQDYFDHAEPWAKVPSHRTLAMLRGRNEGVLALSLEADPNKEEGDRSSYCEQIIAQHFAIPTGNQPGERWLQQLCQWTWRVKISLAMETELLGDLRERAEADAIKVFAENLSDLLMAAPAGMRPTLALDPGLRTGCKVAVVDGTGKLVATDTIYPHAPQKRWNDALTTLAKLVNQHQVELIAVGNGTASRETDKLAGELIKALKKPGLTKVMVSEAGASVYSASETAALEFPTLDVALRGAVSIGRRLQDPLAELVKIEPKSIGVGQYQHDVSQTQLARSLDAVVEDCVNGVGVDLNTASVPLLTRVAGLSRTLAQNIVQFRDEHGRFTNRKQLLKVARLGPKAYEQCAGFLRIAGGDNPLDGSGVHPEAYPVVKKISAHTGVAVAELVGNSGVLQSLRAGDFTDERFGLPTVNDILKELDKPGRDPRGQFETAAFAEGVEKVSDLEPGMVLEGVVTNVANFGAFVDIGVHQDGLVHISALSNKFVEDPRTVVKAGDVVKVKVMEVDVPRQRIGLSMRLDDQPGEARSQRSGGQDRPARQPRKESRPARQSGPTGGGLSGAFADAFANAKKRR